MLWLQRLDLAVFRFFNRDIATPMLDPAMQFLSGNTLFLPTVIGLVAALWIWGGRRGRIFTLVMVVTLAIGDPLIVGNLKKAFGRQRPFVDHPETRLLAGKGTSLSMPSGHAAIWGAITAVAFVFYRGRWIAAGAIALGVGISRLYLGVHYPTDVLAGWAVGAAYGVLLARMAAWLWTVVGRAWFPLWWRRMPRLLSPDDGEPAPGDTSGHWTRLGWLTVGTMLAVHWYYVGAGIIELSEDEAYQWMWSKHLALSYYSKPPLIAYAHWLGTHVAGDTELGVRLLPPLLAALLGLSLQRFVTRHTDARTGFVFLVVLNAIPLLAVGSVLLTIDPLTVCFCTLGMLAGWRAITEDSTRWWLWVGVAWAGGFLSKYFAPFQVGCAVAALAVVPGGWRQLRRPGPWLALGILGLSTIPVLAWNAQHGWITLRHLGERGGLDGHWHFTLRYLQDFLVVVPLLLNPVFAGLAVVAAWRTWRRPAPALERYLWVMGMPILLFYLAYTLRSRVQPNWIAGGVVPVALLATLHWHRRWKTEGVRVGRWLAAGLAVGIPAVILLHDTHLVTRITGIELPPPRDPLRRVRSKRDMALKVGEARKKLEAEGKPVFVIADHYGRAGLVTFYLPEAREAVQKDPFVYELDTGRPASQLALWPGYRARKGQNAVFILEASDDPGEKPEVPAELLAQFESIAPMEPIRTMHRGRHLYTYYTWACRTLK
ncbi:MAG: phosphatase PAP2 family protein [Verrucomicrobia bacterium]|nr:MAG: phosphatase PAP2 family protein [Verrucomicrobiota bacterium]